MLIAPSVSVSEALIDSINCFFLFLFSSHLETSCFLDWMNFKVMVAHLKSENWGFSHSLPLSWVVEVIHGNSEFTSWRKLAWWFVFIAFGGKNKPHQPGPDFLRARQSGTYNPLGEVSRSSVFHPFLSCWYMVIFQLVRTSTSKWGGAETN